MQRQITNLYHFQSRVFKSHQGYLKSLPMDKALSFCLLPVLTTASGTIHKTNGGA